MARRWWEGLADDQRRQLSVAAETFAETFESLPDAEDGAEDADDSAFYDFLVNHELRWVRFAGEELNPQSWYRVMSFYLGELGADYRHGEPGSVR